MRRLNLWLALVVCGTASLPAHAFEFDVWRSGMGLSEILATARDHDLPIAPTPLIHVNKGYNHQIATRDAGKHSSYTYATRLMEWPARVTLKLTPYSRELHTVDVAWAVWNGTKTDRELLEANLLKVLSQKYGNFSWPLPGSLGDLLLYRGAKQWSPSKTDRVLFQKRPGGVPELHYVDLTLRDKATREDAALRRKRAEQGLSADAERF